MKKAKEKKIDKKHKTPKNLIYGWGTFAIALTIIGLLLNYVTFFATDYMGIPAATVGIIIMISKIFDGFTDFVAGYLIDNTNSKLGKGRPYDLAILGYAGCTILLFGAPEMGLNASCVYLFIMYSLIMSVFYTFICCNETVYMANAIEDSNDSVKLSSVKGITSMIVGVAAGIILPQIIKNYGTTRQGWFIISIALMIPCMIIGMIRFTIVKERRSSIAEKEKLKVKDMIGAIKKNKYVLIYALVIFIVNIGYNSANNVATYYAQYILGDIGAQSVLALANVSTIVLMAVVPIFTKKFGFLRTVSGALVVGTAGFLFRLVNPSSLLVIFVASLFSNMGFMAVISFGSVFIIDCIEYGEWKSGKRSEGVISAVPSFSTKIGTALGAAMVGLLMGISGYDGTLDIQSQSANNMIICLGAVVPAVICILTLIVLHFFDLEKKMPQIRRELKDNEKQENL